jgi:Holliday junction resolvasome RuvABC endonuclease subunit
LNILVIDQSTNLNGWVVFSNPYVISDYGIINLSKLPKSTDQDQAEKRYQFLQQIEPLIEKYDIRQVITEGIFIKNKKHYKKLAMMQGCIQDYCRRKSNICCFSWENASEWRKILKLNGAERKDDKELAKQYIIDLYGLPDNLSDDIYDAASSGTAYYKMLELNGIE